MLIYVPFIYFTTWLIIHLMNPSHRFGAGAMALLWVDMSAFFSILLDYRNLYDTFGCNPYAISWIGIILYCVCWTIVLYPLLKLDQKDISITLVQTKSRFFTILCYFFIACMLIHLSAIDINEIIAGFSRDLSDSYSAAVERETYAGGAKQYLLWIPNIISSFGPMYLLFWFISITLCKQNWFIRIGMLLSSTLAMVSGFANGGRAQLIWWVITFLTYFFLFKPIMSPSQRKKIFITMLTLGGIAIVGLLLITLSRFDEGGSYALDSLISYAGQQINNFCTIIPHCKSHIVYADHLFPLYNYVVKHQPFRLQDYHAILENVYPYLTNVFFTFFGDLLHDIGYIGLFVFMLCYTLLCKILLRYKEDISIYHLFIILILLRLPIEGLFSWPFTIYNDSLFILFSGCLYICFRYEFTYGSKKIF